MGANEIFRLVGRIAIDSKDANEKIDETTGKAQNLGSALEGAGKSADTASSNLGENSSFSTAADWMGNTLYKLTEKAVELGLNIGKLGFNYNADMESYKIAFTTMMGGNAEAAGNLIDQLRELGSVTPMNTAGLVANAKTMMGFGIASEDVIDTLKMLGDAAQGNQQSLDSMVLAYSQMMAAGQLYSQDAYQMTNAGVPIWTLLSEYLDEEISVLREYARKGLITPDMVKGALEMATSAGGLFYQAMENQSETFTGKVSTLQDNAEMATGNLMQSFFDVAKSDVLPKLTESLEAFSIWATENQETLTKIAEGVGKFATMSFDAVIDCFKWLTENSDATATAIGAIGTAMGIAAVTAHPYAAAISAIAGALMLLNSEEGERRGTFDHMFDGYTEEDIEILNRYVDALNELRAAEDVSSHDYDANRHDTAISQWNSTLEEVKAIEGLLATYDTWHSAQAGYEGRDGRALKVEILPADDAETSIQTTVDGMNIEATVTMHADTSGLQADVNGTYLSAPVRLHGSGRSVIDGSHANGLDYVPYDHYIAELHRGETVLNSMDASAWRSGISGNVESLLSQVVALLSQQKNVVLDSGAVVGQLAPAMDARLGTISNRKGRRN